MKRLFPAAFLLLALAAVAVAADTPAPAVPDRFDLSAKLKSTIDLSKAKDGDDVTFEVTKDAMNGSTVVLPKKAKLSGKLYRQGQTLSVVLQRAEWGGNSVPLNASFGGNISAPISLPATASDSKSGSNFNPNDPRGDLTPAEQAGNQAASDPSLSTRAPSISAPGGDTRYSTQMFSITPDAKYGSSITPVPNQRAFLPGGDYTFRHLDADYNPSLLLNDNAKGRDAVQKAREGSAKGDADSEFTLGSLYLQGAVLKKDSTKAASWLLKAADQGVPQAQTDMGVLYIQGDGVAQDPVASYMWFKLATDAGQAQDQRALTMLEGQLKPEQIAEAKKRADDWKQQHKK